MQITTVHVPQCTVDADVSQCAMDADVPQCAMDGDVPQCTVDANVPQCTMMPEDNFAELVLLSVFLCSGNHTQVFRPV